MQGLLEMKGRQMLSVTTASLHYALSALSHLILMKTPWSRFYCKVHVIDEETESWRLS